ncbi:MAG TPA: AAA family ATPase [Clostridia bacterium]|nr:AAA family ATPase [Clostridia bacterium]
MKKIDAILEDSNYKYDKKTKQFDNENLDIYTTYKYLNSKEDKIISKYIIIDCLKNNFINIIDRFEEFQKKFISNHFYSHRDDIRWNIYTFFIVNKDEIPKEAYDIEKDEDYSRKFIFNTVELQDYLKNGFLGDIKLFNQIKIKTNFVLEWDNFLSENSLNGCMYNKMKKDSINNYIESKKPIRPVGRPSKVKTSSSVKKDDIIKEINEINFSNYREHCFEKEFSYEPGLINLISGSNGSGKSSICEAISLGFCGENGSIEKVRNESVLLNCKNVQGNRTILSSQKTPRRKRELDLTWYGTTTTGYKSRLYENFTVFNYIQANTIYKNTGKDFNELLKNLLYGEETTKIWKNIQNYKSEFENKINELRKNKKNIEEKLKEKKLEINKVEEISSNSKIIYDDEYDIFDSLQKNRSFNEILDKINPVYYDLERLIESGYEFQEIKTYKEIKSKLGEFNKKVTYLQDKKTKINNLEEKEKRIKEKISNINIEIKDLDSLRLDIEELKVKYSHKINEELFSAKNNFEINNEFNSIRLWEGLKNEYYKNEFKSQELRIIIEKHKKFIQYDYEINFDQSKYNYAKKIYTNLLKEQKNIKERILEKQKHKDLSNKIKTDIYRYGKEYQKINESNSRCPLCGFDYKQQKLMEEAIENTASLDKSIDNELDNLIQEEQKNKIKINNSKKELEKLEKEKVINKEFLESIEEFKKFNINIDTNIPYDLYKEANNLLDSIEKFLFEKKHIVDLINNITKKDIFVEFNNQNDIKNFILFIENKIKKINNEITVKLDYKKDLEQELIVISKDLENKEKILNDYKNITHKTKSMKENIRVFNNIKSNFIGINDTTNIKDFFNSLDTLKKVLEQKIKREVEDKYKESILSEYENITKELETEKNKMKRCKEAINIFDQLTSLEDNMNMFIRKNEKFIEKIFKMIHRPDEFIDLEINEGNIIFKRKSTKEITKIENISTGQAISLIFAVTICLHFSAKNTPKILILDEPVANLDDMHIMNFVDTLREIALKGVQIFITTANEQVATYLRRKFSCFTKDFKHLDIQRTDENPSKFIEKTYLPYKESPEIIEIKAV